MCGRKSLTFLLVLLFAGLCFSQESLRISAMSQMGLWSDIDQTLNLLEEQTNDMQTLSEKQGKRITELENAYQSTYLLWLNSESKSQELEQDMSKCKKSLTIWRGVAIGSAVTTIVTIAATMLVVRYAQ